MQLSNKFLAAVLVVAGLSMYALSFGDAMFWDDDDFILHNRYIQDTQYLPKLFSENVIAGSGLISDYWRPVLLLVFSAEWHAWGEWLPGWHMVNTFFHVTNGLLVFWLLLWLLARLGGGTQTLHYAPTSYRVINNLGMAHADRGQLGQAMQYYSQAVSLDSKNPVAYHNLGNAYEELGDPVSAVAHYQKAIKANSGFIFSYPKLINGYAQLKEYNLALQTLDAYTEQVSSSPDIVSARTMLEAESLKSGK